MGDPVVLGAFSGGKSLLASRARVQLVDTSLNVVGTAEPAEGDGICAIALSANGEHAAIAMESGGVLVWSTQTLVTRVVVTSTMTAEERLMASVLGEKLPPRAWRLAVSNDGMTVSILAAEAGEPCRLILVGRHSGETELERVERWSRLSMEDGHVVLGRHRYAHADLTRHELADEVIARAGDATLVRTTEGEIALKTPFTLLGHGDDAGFTSDEIVLVRILEEGRKQLLEVKRFTRDGRELDSRSLPWDSNVAEAVVDCAKLRGVVNRPEGPAWVNLKTGGY